MNGNEMYSLTGSVTVTALYLLYDPLLRREVVMEGVGWFVKQNGRADRVYDTIASLSGRKR